MFDLKTFQRIDEDIFKVFQTEPQFSFKVTLASTSWTTHNSCPLVLVKVSIKVRNDSFPKDSQIFLKAVTKKKLFHKKMVFIFLNFSIRSSICLYFFLCEHINLFWKHHLDLRNSLKMDFKQPKPMTNFLINFMQFFSLFLKTTSISFIFKNIFLEFENFKIN